MPGEAVNRLGAFLKDRRTRLDPAAFGFPQGRRRTPGLRREEIAQRANISPTWYTWLEQGRGGAPSPDVLDRIARGLMLTEPEREHLYMLALGRPPEVLYQPVTEVTPRLQRVLDGFNVPAMIKTAMWDVVAWNRAAALLLMDYGALPPNERNILRMMFSNSRVREAQEDWASVARYVVGAFRANATRAGASDEATRMVEELSQLSPEFEALWQDNNISTHIEGLKHIRHPELGKIALEISGFAVDGRPELAMVVYNPASAADAERVQAYLAARP
jgi:transcriptional regulator with XRE-family HTH domain